MTQEARHDRARAHAAGVLHHRLTEQHGASPHTIAAYRDTWQLLLRHITGTTGKPPQALDFCDLTAEVIGAVKAAKVMTHKYRRREKSHNRRGHRQKYLKVKITAIQAN